MNYPTLKSLFQTSTTPTIVLDDLRRDSAAAMTRFKENVLEFCTPAVKPISNIEATQIIPSTISYKQPVKITAKKFTREWSKFEDQEIYNKLLDHSLENHTTLVLCEYKPGAVFPAHYHDETEWFYVVYGTIYDPFRRKKYKAHQTDRIPAGVPHSWHSPDGCLLLVQWEPAILDVTKK